MDDPLLLIRGLCAGTESREILRGLDLTVGRGEVHALMGPNGTGKSTLTHVLAGRPGYEVTDGQVTFESEDLLALAPHERARLGLFVAFQYPVEVPGVELDDFLLEAAVARGLEPAVVGSDRVNDIGGRVGLTGKLHRPLNVGYSGGEKKRNETLQLSLLRPSLAVLDEIDSGLDVDGIEDVAAEVLRRVQEDDMSVLVITHYARILQHLPATHVHVMLDGRVITSGGPELADQLEEAGYDTIRQEVLGESAPSASAAGLDPFAL